MEVEKDFLIDKSYLFFLPKSQNVNKLRRNG